jgi:hypothetical protein
VQLCSYAEGLYTTYPKEYSILLVSVVVVAVRQLLYHCGREVLLPSLVLQAWHHLHVL